MTKIYVLFALVAAVFTQTNQHHVSASVRGRQRVAEVQGKAKTLSELRTRLGFSFSTESSVNGFVQVQDSRVFGTEPSTLANSSNLDLHQGYVTLPEIFSYPTSITFGRKELALDNQRFVGSVGWHNVGRSFDGVFLSSETEFRAINLFYTTLTETQAKTDSGNVYFVGLHTRWQLTPAWRMSAYYYDRFTRDAPTRHQTIGTFQHVAAKPFSFSAQIASQFGENALGTRISAWFAALRSTIEITKKLNFLADIELISGDDPTTSDVEAFDLLYGTNHKFNGIFDKFFVGESKIVHNGLNTFSAGLVYNKALRFDVHTFFTAEKATAAGAAVGDGKQIATEFDLRYGLNYSKEAKLSFGFSYFQYADSDLLHTEKSDIFAYAMCQVSL